MGQKRTIALDWLVTVVLAVQVMLTWTAALLLQTSLSQWEHLDGKYLVLFLGRTFFSIEKFMIFKCFLNNKKKVSSQQHLEKDPDLSD